MPEYIMKFNGEYRFLSNFWICDIPFEGHIYKSTEHAFQAAKTNDESEREMVRNSDSAGDAKRAGKKVTLRKDWEEVKDSIMLAVLRIKFSIHKDLEEKLLSTGDKILVEGTTAWHDNYFGVCSCDKCTGQGKNILGELLMQVRKERKVILECNAERRGHEECVDCAKEKVQPQICNGHASGPSSCLEFQPKVS